MHRVQCHSVDIVRARPDDSIIHVSVCRSAPFRDGELDEASLRRLVQHYAGMPVDGFILAATSGEGMSLSMGELERLVAVARAGISASH